MNSTDCELVRRSLIDLLDGALSGDRESVARAHLAQCGTCASEFRRLEEAWNALPPAESVTPPRDAGERVRSYARYALAADGMPPRRASRRQWVAAGGVGIALAAVAVAMVLRAPEVTRVIPGAAAPAFEAVDVVSGAQRSLADYRGEIILLNIWATWCRPCEDELPSMERLYRELGPEGLRVVAVSVDRESRHKVQEWVEQLGLTFTILQDRSGRIEELYQTTGVPESFVIDQNGVILKREIGPREWDSAVQSGMLRRLLALDPGE